jgi:hypothetical protein
MTTRGVCEECNVWAGREIDQPWLRDDWTLIHRAAHDVVDPRRGRKARRIPSPLLQGFTDDGVRVTMDEAGRPLMGSRIIERGDGRMSIVAGSMEEAERLLERVRRSAAKEGKRVEIGEWQRTSLRPKITASSVVNPVLWRRIAAKIALGVGAKVYPHDWRLSEDAAELRNQMRDPHPRSPGGEPLGLFPERLDNQNPLRWLFEPPEHGLFFMRMKNGTTALFVVLFGELFFAVPIDTTGGPVPRLAWRMDPSRPDLDGGTTFEGLMVRQVERLSGEST